MTEAKFCFHDKIIFLLLIINAVIISSIPGGFYISHNIYFIQFGLFIFYVISYLDFNSLVKYRLPKFNFIIFAGVITFFLFIISAFIVNWTYNNDILSFSKLLTYPILFFLFFNYLSKTFFENEKLFDKFTNVLLIIGVLVSASAVLMYLSGFHLNTSFTFGAGGIFGHPNTIAFVYTIVIPILFFKYFTNQYSFHKFSVILFILLCGLLLSFSRAGYIGSCIAILIFTYKKSKVGFAITVVILLVAFLSFFQAFIQHKGDSSYPRMLLALTAIDMIFNRGSRYMLWGYGIFNNIKVFTSDKLLFGSVEQVVDPHNLFLLLSIQFGVLITIAILIIFIYIITRALLLKKRSSNILNQRINLCLSIVLGLFFQDIFEDIVVYPEYFVMPLFLIFIGYLYNVIYRNKVDVNG